MAKLKILQAGDKPAFSVSVNGDATPQPNICDNCKFADPNRFDGAVKLFCLRFPQPVLKKDTDWCGEYQQEV